MSLTEKIGQVLTLSTLIFGSFIPTAFSASVPQENIQQTKSQTLLAKSTVKANNFKYQIKNCRRVTEEVICEILVTNTSNKNRRMSFSVRDGRGISLYGDTYKLEKIVLGEEIATITKSKYDAFSDWLTPGIPVKLNYHFAIPQRINKLAGIEVRFNPYSSYKVAFRNITIANNRSTSNIHNCK